MPMMKKNQQAARVRLRRGTPTHPLAFGLPPSPPWGANAAVVGRGFPEPPPPLLRPGLRAETSLPFQYSCCGAFPAPIVSTPGRCRLLVAWAVRPAWLPTPAPGPPSLPRSRPPCGSAAALSLVGPAWGLVGACAGRCPCRAPAPGASGAPGGTPPPLLRRGRGSRYARHSGWRFAPLFCRLPPGAAVRGLILFPVRATRARVCQAMPRPECPPIADIFCLAPGARGQPRPCSPLRGCALPGGAERPAPPESPCGRADAAGGVFHSFGLKPPTAIIKKHKKP